MGLRRWETYVALLAVIFATLSPMAENPKTTIIMVCGAVALILLVGVALLRRAKVKKNPPAFDPYERAARIREERERRTNHPR